MTIEKKNLLEDGSEEDSQQDNEATQQREEERAELERLREKAKQDEIARIKAEAELEAHRKFSQTTNSGQVQTFTDEQWAQAEANTGMTRQQILASGQLANQVFDSKAKGFEDRVKAAEERAARAEEKANRYESKHSSESVMRELFDAKPALSAYKKEFSEFVDMFPEADRNDPEKLKKIVAKAETYVKGIVGGRMRTNNSGNNGSAKLSGGWSDEGDDNNEERIDLSDLEDKHSRRLVEDIHSEFSSRSDKELVSQHLSADKRGVRVDSAKEFSDGDVLLRRRSSFGGKKGE